MASFVLLKRAPAYFAAGTISFRNDTLKLALLSQAAAGAIGTAATWADVSAHEITTGNGYPAGGVIIPATQISAANRVTINGSDQTVLKLDDVTVAASGGSIPAWRYYFLYKEGSANGVTNPAFGYGVEVANQDSPLTPDGSAFTMYWPTAGLIIGEVL